MNYLYLLPLVAPEPDPGIESGRVTDMGIVSTRQRYLSHDPMPDYDLVGQWESDGTLISCDQALYETYFKDFGNNPDGSATGVPGVHQYMGQSKRNMQDIETAIGDTKYPAASQPFSIRMEHNEITEGAWQGHGWIATMISDDPNRDIAARAIGIYSNPECTAYLYTTGAFVMVDQGDGTFLPQTECPPGYLKLPDREPIYFALLLGAGQEGIMILPVEVENVTRNFWSI